MRVLVIPANEEQMIALDTLNVVGMISGPSPTFPIECKNAVVRVAERRLVRKHLEQHPIWAHAIKSNSWDERIIIFTPAYRKLRSS